MHTSECTDSLEGSGEAGNVRPLNTALCPSVLLCHALLLWEWMIEKCHWRLHGKEVEKSFLAKCHATELPRPNQAVRSPILDARASA